MSAGAQAFRLASAREERATGSGRNLAPTIDRVAANAQGFKVVKVNADECADLIRKYNVQGLPSLLVFKGGQVVQRTTGGMGQSQLESWMRQACNGNGPSPSPSPQRYTPRR